MRPVTRSVMYEAGEGAASTRAAGGSKDDEQALYLAMAPMLGIDLIEVPADEFARLTALAAVADRVAEGEARQVAQEARAREARERREIAEADALYPLYAAV